MFFFDIQNNSIKANILIINLQILKYIQIVIRQNFVKAQLCASYVAILSADINDNLSNNKEVLEA